MPHRLLSIFFSCLCLVVVAAPRSAHAEDKARALELVNKGEKALAHGDRLIKQGKAEKATIAYGDALDFFNEAYGEFSSPQLYYPIAKAEKRLGRNMDAMLHYQAVLRGTKNPKPALVEKVESAIVDIRTHLVALDLTVEQDGAVVSVDGIDIGLTPLDGPQYMPPGEHRYEVTLDGYGSAGETFDLDPGEVATRQIRLDVTTAKATANGDDEDPSDADGGWGSKRYSPVSSKPLTISFGVAGILLAGSAFSAIATKSRHDRYQDFSLSLDERSQAQSSGKKYRLATDLLLGGGLIAAAYGTYYYYSTYKKGRNKGNSAEERSTASRVRITPYASGSEAGVALGATF